MSYSIIHMDEDILVVDKPANLSVLPEGWEPDAPYLVKILKERFGRIWVVHRLDKVTSGVILFARHAESHRQLNDQFERHAVQKTYQALVNGVPAWQETTACHPLRTNAGRSHRTIVDTRRGKPAVTQFQILERFAAHALVKAMPESGRTHQIRVHLAALGYPILSDSLYGAAVTDLIERPALHACSLAFIHPASRQLVSYSAPHPQDFTTARKRLSDAG